MNPTMPLKLTTLFDSTVCFKLTETLLHFLWQGVLIGLAVWTMNQMLRKSSARLRYVLNVFGLAIMIGCAPLTIALLPPTDLSDSVPMADLERRQLDESALDSPRLNNETTTAFHEAPELSSERIGTDSPLLLLAADASLLSEHMGEASSADVSSDIDFAGQLLIYSPYVTAAYLAGVVVLLARLMFAVWGCCRLRQHSEPFGDVRFLKFVQRQARLIGLRSVPHVAYCAQTAVPVVIGVLRPTILLPVSIATGLAPDQLQAILLHEMAHIRRYDLIVNFLQRMIESVLFFHPAVWYVSHRISEERENCCDDDVVAAGHEELHYAGALVRMAELCCIKQNDEAQSQLAALAADGGSGSQLKRRVLRLLDRESRLRLLPGGTLPMILIIGFLLTSGVGIWQASAAGQQQKSNYENENTESALDNPQIEVAQISLDDPDIEHTDPKMAAIISALREQERRFRHLETVLRQEVDYEPGKWTVASQIQENHTIRQGELLYYEGKDVTRMQTGEKMTPRRVSAYNGTRTVSIENDNCANIHPRRYEPSQVLPPHTWGIFNLYVNFPLSIYLQGGKALDAHPKVRRLPSPMGTVFEIYKTESEWLGTEKVGEFKCEKILVQRRHRLDDKPLMEYLWLAPERNYHCVKSQRIFNFKGKDYVSWESNVKEFLELVPGLWLPKLVNAKRYDFQALKRGEQKAKETRTLRLKKVKRNQIYPLSQYTPKVPDGLDVFTIGPEGLTDGPHHPHPIALQKSTTLPKIIENIRKKESLYRNLEIVVAEKYLVHRAVMNLLRPGNTLGDSSWAYQKSTKRRRSICKNGRCFLGQERETSSRNGANTSRDISAFDGLWSRMAGKSNKDDPKTFLVRWAGMERRNNVRIDRPHTMSAAALDDGRALSEFLSSEFSNVHNKWFFTEFSG